MNRVNIHFDEYGSGTAEFDGEYADGVWGITLKEVEDEDGIKRKCMQLFVLVDVEVKNDDEHPDAPLWQSPWGLTYIGKEGQKEIHYPKP